MANTVNAAGRLDRLPISRFHWKILGLIAGGAFLDAFDIYLANGSVAAMVKDGFTDLRHGAMFVSSTFVGMMIGAFVAGYVGDGSNRWPAVHRLDAAHLVRLALEQATPAARVHAVGEEGIPTRDIAEAIGAGLGLPVASIAPDDVDAHFGWIGRFFGMDIPASSTITRERYGWTPTGPTLLEDFAAGLNLPVLIHPFPLI